ncbi:transmembrane protein 132C isoform X2 [Clupea harengus]|uniref:Transmembrane protein 132C isoform X2 n=1 Tax=Clupea harengus TaxID=7950 RepID=A0A6P8FRU0_CLUHA|nr:transmembrane protein 132C isoform X2 [Clupea harengus]
MPKMNRERDAKGDGRLCQILKWALLTSLYRAVECRGGVEAAPKFSSALPTYLPVSCQLQGAESSFFLREAGQEAMRNGSLQTRSEPLYIHLPEAVGPSGALSINCSYANLTAEAPVPVELLQGSAPGSPLLPSPAHVTPAWKVRAHVVARRVPPERPWLQVLFYLAGRRWDMAEEEEEIRLPCVRLLAQREPGEVPLAAQCRLEGSLGICVAALELPTSWFTPAQSPRRRTQEAAPPSVELYYSILPAEGAGRECPAPKDRGKSPSRGYGGGLSQNEALQNAQPLGRVVLGGEEVKASGSRLRLDDNVEIAVPPSPVKQGQTVGFQISMSTAATVEQFTLRAMYREGINFVVLKPSNLASWEIKQEVVPGSSFVSMFCQRKASSLGLRLEGSFYEVMSVDFEIDNFINLKSTQTIRWQIEYPATGLQAEALSYIYISQRDIQGIVPLAENTEILNTAILTGQRVSVPVKLVTVEQDGTVREVDNMVGCASTDEDVVKVSPGCDSVLVNGKEMRGRQSLMVNFTYLYLSTQLELTVWVPRLPLQIDVSDTELSQVKGWRVPILSNKRPTRDSDDDEDDDRRGRGCTLQYQYALVRVLTHFVAEPTDPGGELVYMLGADWQADITDLVQDYLKVEDPRIARLIDGRVLMGRDLGITTIQVISPLSDSILAEKTVTVLDDKVTISDLGVQLVASLSLSLQPSPADSRAIYVTTTAQDLFHAPKQEAVISAWIQYSDGSVTPLNIYDPRDFTLTATSLDEAVVSTYQDAPQKWPMVQAEGEGQGALVKVEMVISETCQKSKRKSVLASGVGNVRVKFGQNDVEQRGGGGGGQDEGEGGLDNSTSEQRQKGQGEEGKTGSEYTKYTSAAADREEGAVRKVSTTTKTTVTKKSPGAKQGGGGGQTPVDYTSIPAQVELPGGAESDLTQSPRGLSDLEIGMYALLGVFCLAILVFLINCVSFAFKYRHKQLPVLEQGNMNHAHDWVWLGNEAELMDHHHHINHHGPLPHTDECTTAIDRSDSCEESKYLLNGSGTLKGSISAHGQTLPRTLSDPRGPCVGKDPSGKAEPLNNSPRASKGKRVKFTSYATVLPDEGGPYTNSILVGNEDDIKWVCQDMDLGQSAEIRTYMERLQDNL